jgi:hypothetical protein
MIDDATAKNADIRNEVVTAYNEVLRKLKVTKRVTQQEEKMDEEKKQIVEAFVRETPDTLAKNLIDLKYSINEAIKEIESRMVAEQDKLHQLQRVIDLKNKELLDVNEIKVNVDSFTALVTAQKEKMEEFEREMKERKQALEYEILQKRREWDATKRDLELEMDSKRMVLDEEFKEREARILGRELEYQQLKDREATIVAREQEYRELKLKVEERFPIELQQAVQKTELAVKEHYTLKYEYEAKLAQKEMEAERKVYQQTIAMLEAKISRISHELQNITNI